MKEVAVEDGTLAFQLGQVSVEDGTLAIRLGQVAAEGGMLANPIRPGTRDDFAGGEITCKNMMLC